MSLHVIDPGALSLVQDAGRPGFQRYGVSVSGAIDQEALLIGNLMVGNEPTAACIEITFGGAEFSFSDDVVIAITGGDLVALIDGVIAPMWQSFTAPSGSVLQFGTPVSGLRAYVSVAGGIDTTPVLDSRSTHTGSRLGGLSGGPLAAGDELPVGELQDDTLLAQRLPDHLRRSHSAELSVRVIAGPQSSAFTELGHKTFLSSTYTVTETSDRQGLRLEGPEIEAVEGRYDIVSDAVVFGAIQIPGDGKPIVLLADRQTTGGYAKIGVVASVDLPLLAQAVPGTHVSFSPIEVRDAQRLARQRRSSLLEADYLSELIDVKENISMGGVPRDTSLSFSRAELDTPQGTFIEGSINGQIVTARAAELR